MKRIIINETQFQKLVIFENNHNKFMASLEPAKKLNESVSGHKFLNEVTKIYTKAAQELKENSDGAGLGYSLLEGALALGIPAQTMLTLAEGLGVPPKTQKNMQMGYFQKLERTDKYLSEELLTEGLVDYLSKLLRGKTGDALKKTILSLVMAGKLAMVSSTALAGAASQMDASIDPQQFKTELEAAKSNGGGSETGAVLTPEQKKTQLGILATSSIKTEDGKVLGFNYNGSFESFDQVNADNYPQFKAGTPEARNLDAAFAKAKASGEGVVNGVCTFVRGNEKKVFQGSFVLANGLWYKFNPQAVPTKTPVAPETTPKPVDPVPTEKVGDKGNMGRVSDPASMKMDNFTGLFQGAKAHYDHLKSNGKAPADFKVFVAEFMKKNDDRLSHLSNEQVMELFKNGFKINIQTIPPRQY